MVFASLVGIKSATPAFAQDGEAPCSVGVGVMNSFQYGVPGRGTAPYTAKIKATFEHRLADGNTIHGFAYLVDARDSNGRTRTETGLQCRRGDDGKPELEKEVRISDPKEHTFLSWQEGQMFGSDMGKKATLMHIDTQATVSSVPPRPKPTSEELAARRKAIELRHPQRPEIKSEDLGTRNIAGVEAQGNRTTQTIPAGEQGNDLPLTVVTEVWSSKELGLTMLYIHDDPRYGRSVQEIEEVDKEEPVAALFAPPEGYKIVEFKQRQPIEVPATSAQ